MKKEKTIREIIEQRISAAGISKLDFARAIGRTAGSLNDLLSSPSWPSLEKMASVLGISVSELVSDDDKPRHTTVCPHCGHELIIELK